MGPMERVLFYLPVVTPWWFDTVVVHMIRALVPLAEVHVLVPPLWRNTGIGPEQLAAADGLEQVQWHIADGPDQYALRNAPDDPEAILGLVRSIDPAITFCRSADIETPARFPGLVRHLMEAGAPPFPSEAGWIMLQEDFWHHGALPPLAETDRAAIDKAFATAWKKMRNRVATRSMFRSPRDTALARLGLPANRRIIVLPLEYEHEEAFTAHHNVHARNIDLVRHAHALLDEDMVLALTDHPLNIKHVDNRALYAAIADLGPQVRLVPSPSDYHPTDALIRYGDGLIVQNTKALYSGAFFGKPVLRWSHRPSAGWLGVHTEAAPFLEAVREGRGGAREDDARSWFGCHFLHDVFDPAATTGAQLLDRVRQPFARARLADGIARLDSQRRQLACVA